MIVTPRFVLLHLHKSGGSFANAAVLRHVPGAREIGYHLPRRLVPPAAASLPVLGFVRNPLSYYVSWYAFQHAKPRPNALFRVLSDDGRLDFRGTIGRMLDLADDASLLARACAALPAAYGNRGLNLPGPALAPIAGSGLGFYSYLFRYLFDAPGTPTGAAAGTGADARMPDAPRIGRMETLRDDLPRLLRSVGEVPSPAFEAFVATAPKVNTSVHGAPADVYDAALAGRVRRADAALIEAFGYD